MKTSHLFVYGTLRPTAKHSMGEWLAARANFVGATTLEGGALYELDGFPGLKSEAGHVQGDLYQLPEVRRKQVLEVLDEYEGLDPVHGYERTIVELVWEGEPVSAWVYFFRGEVRGRRRIPHGDWLRWVSEGDRDAMDL